MSTGTPPEPVPCLHDERALEPGLDREGAGVLVEVVPGHPVLDEEGADRVHGREASPPVVHGGEYLAVEVVQDPERVRDVVGAGVKLPDVVEDGRHPHEPDMVRQGLDPRLQVGLEAVAVGTAVPEHLDHLDLVGVGGRLRGRQLPVEPVNLGLRGGGECEGKSEEGGGEVLHTGAPPAG